MSRFKIGQRVVCVDDERGTSIGIKYGEEYVIDGFTCCGSCGIGEVYLVGIYRVSKSQFCTLCQSIDFDKRYSYRESRFAPLSEISEAISELMKETNLITN